MTAEELVERWRDWVAGPDMGTHKACKYILAACDLCERQAARIRELESIQAERMAFAVKQQARIKRLETALKQIGNGLGHHQYQCSDIARQALAEES